MKSLTSKAFVASVFGIVFLTACGGGSSSGDQVPTAAVPAVATTVGATEVVKFTADIQATSTNETAEARDISLIELAGDDTAEPGAV